MDWFFVDVEKSAVYAIVYRQGLYWVESYGMRGSYNMAWKSEDEAVLWVNTHIGYWL